MSDCPTDEKIDTDKPETIATSENNEEECAGTIENKTLVDLETESNSQKEIKTIQQVDEVKSIKEVTELIEKQNTGDKDEGTENKNVSKEEKETTAGVDIRNDLSENTTNIESSFVTKHEDQTVSDSDSDSNKCDLSDNSANVEVSNKPEDKTSTDNCNKVKGVIERTDEDKKDKVSVEKTVSIAVNKVEEEKDTTDKVSVEKTVSTAANKVEEKDTTDKVSLEETVPTVANKVEEETDATVANLVAEKADLAEEVPVVENVLAAANKVEEEIPDSQKISQSIKTNENTSPIQEKPEPSVTSKNENSEDKPSAETATSTSTDKHADHVTYTEDGSAIYTDPETKYQYKWCTKSNNWTPMEAQTSSTSTTTSATNPYENEHYKWCQETQKWIPKQQSQVTETEHYKWDAEKQQWIPKKTAAAEQVHPKDIVYDIDEDGQRIYTDQDGTVFFWDVEKNAWFPKIDEDFMARYQMNYGFIDNTSEAENEKKKLALQAAELKEKELQQMTEEAKKSTEEASKGAGAVVKRKAPPEPPKWFEIDPDHNTKVYVSNLPLDITLDEFAELMGKCGMIMRDPKTQKFKLKLYTEADGQIKGDGLCDYIKVESVHLALKILDEYDLRGHKIRVQQAKFQMRGEYNPALKPKKKKKDKEKLAKIKEKLFDWRPEKMRGERSKNEKTVIIKNLFHPDLFEKEVQLILDYQNDLREECSKCGTVRKVVIYDRHSEGVAQINMSSPEEADLVIQMMQGRFFGKRQLKAEHWDGKTKYKIEETAEEIQKRLNKWDKYLEADAHKSEVQKQDALEDSDEETTDTADTEKLVEDSTKDIAT